MKLLLLAITVYFCLIFSIQPIWNFKYLPFLC